MPRYPIYIPSRGRSEICLTAKALLRDQVPFRVVVAPKEVAAYELNFPGSVIPLPTDSMDIVAVRNWIRDLSQAHGDERHWQLDDNIQWFERRWRGERLQCNSGTSLRVAEDFTDRYENIALTGLNYSMFMPEGQSAPAFMTNQRIYSCTLVLNRIPYRWRGPYNDDTDLCLQVLSGGWCTVLINAFLIKKITTMVMKGGMTDSNTNNYQGDGRLKMSRTLERRWPGVVTTTRRFRRPQHHVFDSWRRFDTPLILKPGIDLAKMKGDEYGLRLEEVEPIKSAKIRGMVQAWRSGKGKKPK